MAERNDGAGGQFGMLCAAGEILHQGFETLLAGVALLVGNAHVPVLRSLLNESHGYAQGVHPAAELRAAEQHLLRHILMTVEHGLHLLAATWQTQVGAATLITCLVVEGDALFLQVDALANVVCDGADRVDICMQAVETCTKRSHRHRAVVAILMGNAMQNKKVAPGIAHLINIFTEVAECSRYVGITGKGRAKLTSDDLPPC